jgi:hypothetical protein
MATEMARAKGFLIIFVAAPLVAYGADGELSAEVGIGSTNNIERAPTGGHSATIGSVGTRLSLAHRSGRIDAAINGDLAWVGYSGNTYDSELMGTVYAATRVGLISDRLSWSIDDSFGQTRRDVFTAPNPSNRENINVASTGPDLRLRLGGALELLVQARYGLVSYQNSPLDSTRKSALVSLQHQLASDVTVGLNVSRARVEPHGAAVFDQYDQNEAYVHYSAMGSLTSLSVDAGAGWIDRQMGATDSSALLRLTLTRKIGGWSTLTAGLGREQTDAAGSLRTDGEQQLPAATLDTQSLAHTAAPYISDYANLGWEISGRVTSIGLGVTWADEKYPGGSNQDRTRREINFTASRQLGPRVTARTALQYARYDYWHVIGDNGQGTADLGLSWRLGRRLSADVSGTLYRYASDAVAGTARESRFWLRLRYGGTVASH